MLTTLKNNRSLTFYQSVDDKVKMKCSSAYAGGILSVPIADTAFAAQIYTTKVNQAFLELKTFVIRRGMQYANNTIASRGGYMAEDFVAGSYNLDAVIKGKTPSARVPALNKNGSADVVYDGGRQAGLKIYSDAKSSAKAQTAPKYEGQDRIVPADHVDGAKKELGNMIDKNIKKGRTDAARIQQEAKDRITDRICGDNGVESTPLTKKQSLDMAKSIEKDENGQIASNKINKILKETGTTRKVNHAILKNELSGLGLAVAIGAGIGLTIGFITTLAQTGVTPDSLKIAVAEGAKAGVESGSLAAVSYGIGRTLGEVATKAITGTMQNLGIGISENMIKMVNMGVVGTMTTIVFSVYQFIKLKLNGVETREALIQVGKQALFSMSLLAVSIAAQGIWGGAAGIIVSISIGIIMIIYAVGDAVHQRHIAEEIRVYTINECYPAFA